MGGAALKSLRIAVVAAVSILAAWGIHRLAWVPFRCNIAARKAWLQTDYAARQTSDYNALVAARDNVRILLDCADRCPWDVRLRFLAAWNLRVLRRYDQAVELYEQALAYDRRPELYLALGNAQIEAGREAAGEDALLQAGRFDRFVLVDVARADIRERVLKKVESEKSRE